MIEITETTKAMITILAALLGSGSGSLAASYYTHSRAKSKEEHQRLERIVQRYLLQLQDAVDSLWFRFKNIKDRSGTSVMELEYFEISTLYAWGRVLAYSRILLLDGIYPQLELIENGLGQFLRKKFIAIDNLLKKFDFQHYHRLALAEALIVKEDEYMRTRIFSEFRNCYLEKNSEIRTSLQPAKDRIERLREKDSNLKEVLDILVNIARRIEKVTEMPSLIDK